MVPTKQKRKPAGKGAVTLELILALPVLLIALLAIVETGVLMANLQAVAAASRDGARFAARSPALNAGTAATIRDVIDDRLQAAGFGVDASDGVTLQHNVGGAVINHTDGSCATPAVGTLPTRAVRVRICVPYEKLAPNLLSTFGLSLTGKVAMKDATFDYEL